MRIAPAMLAIFASLFALTLAVPPTPVAASAAPRQCTNWTSRTQPPPTIRVYRISEGFVEKVDFKTYVIRVVSREWNVDHTALRNAGAHAVKQFAWYHVLNYRGGSFEGKCYDIRDSTADQLYAAKLVSQIPDQVKRSVNATWSWRLYRDGRFIMTGYRRGEDNPCASDGGYRLYVRSARKCANKGWSAERILRVYYTATLKQ
ncbi:MAG: SpoIID/LytB domain-containing protein [Chloroflexota bacterium]